MFKKLKQQNMIPILMNIANIKTVPKQGSRLELKNERGIFGVSRVRSILMRIIYDMKYAIIDRKNLRELSQPQERFAPKFKRNREKI